ncbi:hypothetical protein DFJ73DRAFT_631736 [Zopfochytrium polystomum]|nr:hypothetical protein DFJ73DRAFT_631736 [Zopfochytrium polystomum]
MVPERVKNIDPEQLAARQREKEKNWAAHDARVPDGAVRGNGNGDGLGADLSPEKQKEQQQLQQQQQQAEQEQLGQHFGDHDGKHDHFPILTEEQLSRLLPEQRQAYEERLKFLQEHRGHEKQHAQMALMLMFALVASQFILLYWRKVHPPSFNLASLLGLWVVPPGIGLSARNYRYVFFWFVFSVVNGVVVRRALFENPMQPSTPRLVYKWYSHVYKVSVAVGALGYALVLVTFFHVPSLFGVSEETEMYFFQGGIITLFYGLYFGTLGRDFVDRLSDRMAMMIGYYNKTGFPKKHLRNNVCAICGDSTEIDKIVKLGCEHPFHETCIRGWTIIGKKDCCPYCKEKVDMKAFSRHAWDTTQILYLNLLDMLRYLIVWNPILFMVMHLFFNVLGWK